jgi:glycosyltransferase involved in cell wall biosynthesis
MDITLASLGAQTKLNFEVLISDNASTDNSVAIIKKYLNGQFPLQYEVNQSNIGFAGNLDKVGKMAKAPWMIMLSSDDVVKYNALEVYTKFINQIGHDKGYAFCSTFEKIDSDGNYIEYLSASQSSMWYASDIDMELSQQMGFTVYKVESTEMLKRCLKQFLNPFNFASTCYPRNVYEKTGGYGGGRLYNPDKWFHWKIMSELEYVYYLDIPLFQYRWHAQNQANQQQQNQILKYWLDEYRNCFETSKQMLEKTGLQEYDVIKGCIRHSFLAYSFKYMKDYQCKMALRIWFLALAMYPTVCLRSLRFYIMLLLFIMGPIGSLMANLVKK